MQVSVDPKGDSTIVKVKTRLNTYGVLSFESAYVEEVEEKGQVLTKMEMQRVQPSASWKCIENGRIRCIRLIISCKIPSCVPVPLQLIIIIIIKNALSQNRRNVLEECVHDMQGNSA